MFTPNYDVSAARPAPIVFEDNAIEFEFEDILDMRSVRRGPG